MMIRGPIYIDEINMESVSKKAERVIEAIDKGVTAEFGQYDRRNASIILIGDDRQRQLYEENLAKLPDPEKKPTKDKEHLKTEPKEPDSQSDT